MKYFCEISVPEEQLVRRSKTYGEDEGMEWIDLVAWAIGIAVLALVVRTLAPRSTARRRREARDRALDRLRRFGS